MSDLREQKVKSIVEQFEKEVKVKTLDGPKIYNYTLLTRMEAMEVFHEALSKVVAALGLVAKDINQLDTNPGVLLQAIEAIDFATIKKLASKLLRNSVLDGEEISDFEKTDYFNGKPLELYQAIFHGIEVNFPSVFSPIRETIKGMSIADEMRNRLSGLTSNTVSGETDTKTVK